MDLVQLIADRLRQWRGISCNFPCKSDAASLGRWGEKVAARYLGRHRYRILARNYRARHGGEVDIVARHKPSATLCFIEVKTRSSAIFGRPARAVDEKKRRLIVQGALSWLRLLDWPEIPFRFDIIEVLVQGNLLQPEVNLIENAFQLPPEIYISAKEGR